MHHERMTCRVVGRKMIKVKGKEQMCIVMTHEKFGDKLIHCSKFYAKCTVEGPADKFFPIDLVERGRKSSNNPQAKTAVNNAADRIDCSKEVDESIYDSTHNREDINCIRQLGFDVDDDLDPNPDNIPKDASTKKRTKKKEGPGYTQLHEDQTWCKPIDCERMKRSYSNDPPKLQGKYTSNDLKDLDLITAFFIFFPYVFFQNVIVLQTSNKLVEDNHRALKVKEFFLFLGLILFMATIDGYSMSEFWDNTIPSMENGAP